MPIIEIELTDEEAKALLGIDKPSEEALAAEIRSRVLGEKPAVEAEPESAEPP